MNPPSSSGALGPEAGGRPRRERADRVRHRRAVVLGLAVSVLVHAALIVLYPLGSVTGPAEVRLQPVSPERNAFGVRVFTLNERPAGAVAEPDDPLDIQDLVDPEVSVDVPVLEDALRARLPSRGVSASERLILRDGDPRLWTPVHPRLSEPSPHQILELNVHAAIEAGRDSARAEAERARAALDWTHTDEDGKMWGVSPGRIHLGDIEVPLPFGFGPPPDYSGDRAEWAFRMADIDRAQGTLAARRSWKERLEAMRLRREARRAEEDGQAKAGGQVKPDTTSVPPQVDPA